jgi:hypothetical protein
VITNGTYCSLSSAGSWLDTQSLPDRSTTGLHRQPAHPERQVSRQITDDALLRVDQTRADGMEMFIPAGRLPTVDRTRRKEKGR